MNRRHLFRLLGIGLSSVALAPLAAANEPLPDNEPDTERAAVPAHTFVLGDPHTHSFGCTCGSPHTHGCMLHSSYFSGRAV
jgi:hypothetical protein